MNNSPASREPWERLLRWELRLMGGLAASALVPACLPLAWLEEIHRWLGLGEMPRGPVVEYMARTLSTMYFAYGCVLLVIARDVRRYVQLVHVVAYLHLVLGAIFFAVDWAAGMPAYWMWSEGTTNVVFGGTMIWLLRRVGHCHAAA